MSKIKVSLASGNIFEKPLVTCFQGVSANYIVFDNEMNGSMGLPIICISKLVGNKLEKIYDQSEWSNVKENLKSIISGNNFIYLTVPENLNAQDDFFTQLTLPVASFDVLKNAYKPPVPEQPEVVPASPEVIPTPIVEQKVEQVEPTPVEQNIMENPIPMGPSVGVQTMTNMVNQMEQNINNVNPMQNVIEPNIQPMQPINPIEPNVQPMQPINPIVNEINQVAEVPSMNQINNNDIAQVKETFMKSCENVFDALIKIFENK